MTNHVFFIEGGDGAGKTTTVETLTKVLKENGIEVSKCNIMKFTEVGELIYNIDCFEGLNNIEQFCARTFSVFYNIEKIMQRAIDKKCILICDRNFASTFSYQIATSELDSQIKNSMMILFNHLVNQFDEKYKGQFTEIFLDVDSEVALQRMKTTRKNLDIIESKPESYHKAVNEAYKLFFSKRRNVLTYNTTELGTENIVQSVLKYVVSKNEFKQT